MTRAKVWLEAGLLGALSALAAAACSSDLVVAPAAEVAKPVVKAPVKSVDSSFDPNTRQPFVYSPVGKRDPFRSYLVELSEANSDHTPNRKLEETESYELDQYRLTGLITGTAQPKAMVEDPTGRGHVLHIGSRLGKNSGQVSRISPTGMVVVEETRDTTGKKVRLPIAIRLPKSEFDDVVQK